MAKMTMEERIDHDLPAAETIDPVARLRRDLHEAAKAITPKQARYYVDEYYVVQEHRIRAANQLRMALEINEPTELLRWTQDNFITLEADLKKMLSIFASAQPMGVWAQSVCGIGPVIAAGLIAHIDIEKAPTVGHIWNFAGLNPDVTWKKGEKRPWNADLKRLCWILATSFVKVQSNKNDFYGKLYVQRKGYETNKNLAGDYANRAAEALTKFRYGDDTIARGWYTACYTAENARRIIDAGPDKREALSKALRGEEGSGIAMLPPGHINMRALRWTAKLFLSHWHQVAYETHFQQPVPKPYVLAFLEHVDFIPPPNYTSAFGTGRWNGKNPHQTQWPEVVARLPDYVPGT